MAKKKTPAKALKPSKPAKLVKPAKPTKSAKPVKSAKPQKAVKALKPAKVDQKASAKIPSKSASSSTGMGKKPIVMVSASKTSGARDAKKPVAPIAKGKLPSKPEAISDKAKHLINQVKGVVSKAVKGAQETLKAESEKTKLSPKKTEVKPTSEKSAESGSKSSGTLAKKAKVKKDADPDDFVSDEFEEDFGSEEIAPARTKTKEPIAEEPVEEVVLTDAEGRRICRVSDCDQVATVDGYCRYHYLMFWKRIQVRKKILTEGKLENYIEELTARYPDKFLEMLKKDLRSQKDFLAAIQELELDEAASEGDDFEDDDSGFIEEVRGMSEPAAREEEEF